MGTGDYADFVIWREALGLVLQIIAIFIGLLLPAVQFWR
jgi:hypothetical protein